MKSEHSKAVETLLRIDAVAYAQDPKKTIKEKRAQMEEAVKMLDFETAALLRDEIYALEAKTGKKKKR